MARAEVTARIAAPPAAVWPLVRWESPAMLERPGAFVRVEYHGATATVGAERTLHPAEGPGIRERLEDVAANGRGYGYRIVEPGPLPVRNFVAALRLDADGDAGSRLTVHATFDVVGMDEDAWIARYTEFQTGLFEHVRAQVEPAEPIDDRNVSEVTPLATPRVIRTRLPLPAASGAVVRAARTGIRDILHGRDDRLLVVTGPCSIHDPAAAVEYARKLAVEQDRHRDALVIVMRTYFEKPRTTVGWKGLINDPHLDGSCDVQTGLTMARQVLLDVTAAGVACGSEMLDPITPQYVADIISWASIGARTTESQTHREMASGLSMPIGFKNGTDGGIQVAADAMTSARHPHTFVGIDVDGVTSMVRTRGNPDRHLILRGGRSGINHRPEDVERAATLLAAEGIARPVMIDCSHGNSLKDWRNQAIACRAVLEQVRATRGGPLMGLLLESHLVAGRQDWKPGVPLLYGQSITDACMGWGDTAELLAEAADAVRHSRR